MIDLLEVDLSQQCRALAYDMVRLEEWARQAYILRRWERVGELHAERDAVRERRSALMRQIWRPRRRRAQV